MSQILQANCGSKCHAGDAGQEHMLNLSNVDPGALHMRLTTPLQTDLCFGQRPVKPGLSSTSVLVRVIKAEIGDPCVLPRMPAGCAETNSCLSEADIATIDAWVEATPLPEAEGMAEVTHQDLAERTGTVREIAGRALRELAHEGLVRLERGRVIVLDRDRLARIAEQ